MTAPADAVVAAATDTRRLVDRALDLLSVDTQNPPGETDGLVDQLEGFFEGLGYRTDRVVADPAKPNLLATLPGATDATLCFMGHVDTVPYDADDWTRDPLGEYDEAEGRVYGRGATDMKGPLAAMLEAARAFAEAEGEPPVTLCFAVVSDEETGGHAGVRAMVERDAIAADGCIIGETTCERGRHSVTVADKGSIWLTLEAGGEAAHGSRPMFGTNAIDRLYSAITDLRSYLCTVTFETDPAVDDVIEESVEYYAGHLGEEAAGALFSHPTCNLGTIEGGEAINTVPEHARAELDVRLSPGVDTRAVIEEIRDRIDDHEGVVVAECDWSVGSFTPTADPLVPAVAETAEAVTGDRVFRRSATGGGDAKKLRHAGIPTLEFALGTDTVHGVDEYTTVDALRANAEIYVRAAYAFAEGR
ncbi:M20 family metallopeptidase [Haloarchaeobius amylolyticus]|uniref:M20 family metallopeptidase n=1 Tax=Haloarchaeobius amylolyticus TaxID=1198296 RepID=UPI00226E4325|nr:M20/M25/M40 family metallo-hydrolase [Haloarchaeobius amylolyticus]